jgi:pimeloyl-ACP methyl ester carboxylesterase
VAAWLAARHPGRLHPPVDPWPVLPRIGCPAVVVHGAHSTVMDPGTCRRVAAAMPAGRAATRAGAHHHLIVEEPERFSRIVVDWHRAIIAA